MTSKRNSPLGKGHENSGEMIPDNLKSHFAANNICLDPVLNSNGNFILLNFGLIKPKQRNGREKENFDLITQTSSLEKVPLWEYKYNILWRCNYCSIEFFASPYTIINNGNKSSDFRYRNGTGCTNCMEKRPKDFWKKFSSDDYFKNAELMEEEVRKEGQDFKCLNAKEAKNKNVKLEWLCNRCGRKTITEFYGLVGAHKHGCNGCSGQKLTKSSFEERMKSARPDLSHQNNFQSSEEQMEFHCLNCQKNFKATPSAILGGKQCDHCGIKNDSLMAQQLKIFLCERTGFLKEEVSERTDLLRNPKTNMPLRPDGFVEFSSEKRIWFEVHGEQHYYNMNESSSLYYDADLPERDSLKENFCKSNKIAYLAIKQPIFQRLTELWQKVIDKALDKVHNGEYFHLHLKTKEEAEGFLND